MKATTDGLVPFTILTGFLGAGKTTLLNRVLERPQGRRIAVLVNELGRVAIDSKLILSRGGDVLELAGGCVCCKVDVKSDLWFGIADVVRRSAPDHVVLETTGIAEPDAIVAGLERQPDEAWPGGHERAAVSLAGVVTVVDARAAREQLERHEEARAQVESADRIMLSKLDVAAPDEVTVTRARLAALNGDAEVAAFPAGEDGVAALVPWLLERRSRGRAANAHHHAHGERQLVATSFHDDTPLLPDPLFDLVRGLGERLVRVKGFVRVAGREAPGYLELAGGELTLRDADAWPSGQPRTELVLIGEDLDEAALRRALWACRAGG